MTLYAVHPVLTNSGSGYTNNTTISVASPGAIRYNSIISSFELYDGTYWQPVVSTATVIEDFLEQAKTSVAEHINNEHAGNVTINDALETWLEACDKFKVIIAIAGKSK
jgi:hypothetical protein